MPEANAGIQNMGGMDPFAFQSNDQNRETITRKVSHVGLFSASAVVLGMVNFPFPLAPFLQFDLGFIPVLIGTFKFGPTFGVITLTLFSALFELLFGRGVLIGPLMHIAAGICFIIPASAIYNSSKNRSTAVKALIAGSICQTLGMIPLNWVATMIPYPYGIKGVLPMGLTYYLLVIVPMFNCILSTLNAVITFHLYKKLSLYLR
ncbi:MAG: hypothetical protein CVV64_07565 [Candidatus Wallbacteria bacterium HGW-Wallbacteria-1]|jgi:riboflavin transporter FmnP|uniref:Riboflavin transporter n=1 Tax=Candidatus Wallbacteria bacterium HGW-Wallbacteria-1 TaxID=2013854 RepID=A0A2N1PQY3_9BACT|nr:MAG: hypothetical protein CVV64_07565 [Candidatus Wallbacteria bacterium HGW-Wallbacteria-1]